VKDPFEIVVFKSAEELAKASAELLRTAINEIGQDDDGKEAIMLTGGSTPLAVYKQLAAEDLESNPNAILIMSDERVVDLESDQNNFHNAEAFIKKVCPEESQRIRVMTNLGKEAAAEKFNLDLNDCVHDGVMIPIGFMGMGADNHTAGLFTDDDIARSSGKFAIGVDRPDEREGVSVTPAFLKRINCLIFQITGKEKAEAVKKLVETPLETTAGKVVRDCKYVQIWLDEDAASLI